MTIILKNVKLPGHLTENQHTALLLLQFGQQFVQDHHLAAIVDDVLVSGVRWARLGAIEQVRVVAALTQLHQNVLQAHLLHFAGTVDYVYVLHQHLGIPEICNGDDYSSGHNYVANLFI